ncbi:hypothetical protein D9611_008775 [Ephemerocybe angulata]|uniref:Uncharacterized protein n=1 Tax=Ephemerocybe angulata TaxID=980116 RepID=A0A8H5CDQ6_9AGAR|nr:hypothetical protein D9611_008775 [Tulosesus angulatus]
MLSISRKVAPIPSFVRAYTAKYPRPRPGTAERPPLKHRDPLLNSPNATVTKFEDDGIVFVHRPPPAAAAPESTTVAPSSPLLRKPTPSMSSPLTTPLPPTIRAEKPVVEKKLLSEEDIAKMKELRLSDPEKYSTNTLAKMFGVSRFTVAQLSRIRTSQRKNILKKRDEEHAKHRERWSERHQLVKAVQVKRREFW